MNIFYNLNHNDPDSQPGVIILEGYRLAGKTSLTLGLTDTLLRHYYTSRSPKTKEELYEKGYFKNEALGVLVFDIRSLLPPTPKKPVEEVLQYAKQKLKKLDVEVGDSTILLVDGWVGTLSQAFRKGKPYFKIDESKVFQELVSELMKVIGGRYRKARLFLLEQTTKSFQNRMRDSQKVLEDSGLILEEHLDELETLQKTFSRKPQEDHLSCFSSFDVQIVETRSSSLNEQVASFIEMFNRLNFEISRNAKIF